MKIAAAYIRVSTEDQAEYSPAAQLVEIRRYAEKNGFVIPDEYIYVDEGISGRTDHREAFQRMISTAKQKDKPFDAILLWKFSRFARNREDSIVYKSMLRRKGIDVISITEPTGNGGPTDVLMEAMIEAMDEYYSINLSQEVKRGMTEKARRGGLQSNPSFGYKVKDHRLVPHETEADIIREIFRRWNAGEGLRDLAWWVNDQGITTHRGNKFENRTIEYILRNPVYIGKLRWNPTGRTRRKFDNPNIILADADHEPLIDMETWETAQDRMDTQKALHPYHAKPSYDRKDWLAGVVRCAACGATLVFSKPHYFICNNYVRGQCRHTQHVPVDRLHQAVIDRLWFDAHSINDIDCTVVRAAGAPDERAQIEKQLAILDRKKARAREAYLAGADTVEEYKETRSAIEKQVQDLNNQLASLEDAQDKSSISELLKSKIATRLAVLENPNVGIPEKFEAINSIIDRCIFDRDKNLLEITYRLMM